MRPNLQDIDFTNPATVERHSEAAAKVVDRLLKKVDTSRLKVHLGDYEPGSFRNESVCYCKPELCAALIAELLDLRQRKIK